MRLLATPATHASLVTPAQVSIFRHELRPRQPSFATPARCFARLLFASRRLPARADATGRRISYGFRFDLKRMLAASLQRHSVRDELMNLLRCC